MGVPRRGQTHYQALWLMEAPGRLCVGSRWPLVGGFRNPRVCVPKMARTHFSFRKFHSFPQHNLGGGGSSYGRGPRYYTPGHGGCWHGGCNPGSHCSTLMVLGESCSALLVRPHGLALCGCWHYALVAGFQEETLSVHTVWERVFGGRGGGDEWDRCPAAHGCPLVSPYAGAGMPHARSLPRRWSWEGARPLTNKHCQPGPHGGSPQAAHARNGASPAQRLHAHWRLVAWGARRAFSSSPTALRHISVGGWGGMAIH